MPKFQDGISITVEVMGCQVHATRKARRPLFADPVTNYSSTVGEFSPMCNAHNWRKPSMIHLDMV